MTNPSDADVDFSMATEDPSLVAVGSDGADDAAPTMTTENDISVTEVEVDEVVEVEAVIVEEEE